ncbi:MAG: hypothetical protein CSA97_05265 [Bacteroidetes bacterium]|nr:MAG: hypothetical protein CSA97_05265 [Bacteroidota bacterium]
MRRKLRRNSKARDEYLFPRRLTTFWGLSTLATATISLLYLSQWYAPLGVDLLVYYIFSALSQSGLFLLPALLVGLLLGGRTIRRERVAFFVFLVYSILLNAILLLDWQVYKLFRFHINGMVLALATGPGADEVFSFDPWLWGQAFAVLACLVLLAYAVRTIAFRLGYLPKGRIPIALWLIVSILAHGGHAIAAGMGNSSIQELSALLRSTTPFGLTAC